MQTPLTRGAAPTTTGRHRRTIKFDDLHRLEQRALAQIVTAHEKGQPASFGHGSIQANTADKRQVNVAVDRQRVVGDDQHPHTGSGKKEIWQAEDVAALVADLLLLVGLEAAVGDEDASQRDDRGSGRPDSSPSVDYTRLLNPSPP